VIFRGIYKLTYKRFGVLIIDRINYVTCSARFIATSACNELNAMRLWSNLPQMDAGPGLRWAPRGRRDTIDKPKAGRELVMQPAVYTALCACARAGWPIKASRHSMKPIRSLMFPRGSRYVRERPFMRVLRGARTSWMCMCAHTERPINFVPSHTQLNFNAGD